MLIINALLTFFHLLLPLDNKVKKRSFSYIINYEGTTF